MMSKGQGKKMPDKEGGWGSLFITGVICQTPPTPQPDAHQNNESFLKQMALNRIFDI